MTSLYIRRPSAFVSDSRSLSGDVSLDVSRMSKDPTDIASSSAGPDRVSVLIPRVITDSATNARNISLGFP